VLVRFAGHDRRTARVERAAVTEPSVPGLQWASVATDAVRSALNRGAEDVAGRISFSHRTAHSTAREATAGIDQRPGVVVADAGYWHQAEVDRLVNRAIGVLIPPDAGKRKGARPGRDGGLYAFMRRLLATDFGGELYAKRQGIIEPVFADTKFNRRMDCVLHRGRSACRSEWRLITATHTS
jgi:hypothetical protein